MWLPAFYGEAEAMGAVVGESMALLGPGAGAGIVYESSLRDEGADTLASAVVGARAALAGPAAIAQVSVPASSECAAQLAMGCSCLVLGPAWCTRAGDAMKERRRWRLPWWVQGRRQSWDLQRQLESQCLQAQ